MPGFQYMLKGTKKLLKEYKRKWCTRGVH